MHSRRGLVVEIAWRYRRVGRELPERAGANFQLLHILDNDLAGGSCWEVTDLDVDDVLRGVVDLTVGDLQTLLQRLLIFLPCLFLLFNAADQQSVGEFGREAEQAGIGLQREAVLHFKQL